MKALKTDIKYDWRLFRKQKLLLVRYLSNEELTAAEKEQLWGIVNLLDDIQDNN